MTQPAATQGNSARAPSSHTQRRAEGVALMLMGTPDAEIAEQLGVTRQTVRRWRMRPDVRTQLEAHTARAAASAGEILERSAARAAERLTELVEAEGHVALRAAVAILDRTAHGSALGVDFGTGLADLAGQLLGDEPMEMGESDEEA